MSAEEMPVLVVSAGDLAAAHQLIAELAGEEASRTGEWRIENKYYSARVRVVTSAGDAAEGGDAAQAHVALLQAHEMELASSMLRAHAVCAPRAHVRLALCRAAARALTPALRRAAADLRYELVTLVADEDDEEEEGEGMERARDALHAHTWPGLRRRGSAAAGWDETQGSAAAVERFAAVLGGVQRAREELAEGERRGEGRGERLTRAEMLLQELCRALDDPGEGDW